MAKMMDPNSALTWGLLAFLGTGAFLVFGGAWKLFNVLNDIQQGIAAKQDLDKADLEHDIKSGDTTTLNAVNRLEKKHDESHNVLHGRSNKQMEEDKVITGELNYIKGAQDLQEKLLLKLLDKL